MPTIINNPNPGERGDYSGWLVALVIIIILAILIVIGLPYLRGTNNQTPINVNVPAPTSTTNILPTTGGTGGGVQLNSSSTVGF